MTEKVYKKPLKIKLLKKVESKLIVYNNDVLTHLKGPSSQMTIIAPEMGGWG